MLRGKLIPPKPLGWMAMGDGDGLPNEAEDYQVAAQRGFAIAGTFAEDKWAPYVKEAFVQNVKGGSGEIWAEVEDDEQMSR